MRPATGWMPKRRFTPFSRRGSAVSAAKIGDTSPCGGAAPPATSGAGAPPPELPAAIPLIGAQPSAALICCRRCMPRSSLNSMANTARPSLRAAHTWPTLRQCPLVVVDGHPDAAVLAQKLPQQLQPGQHHRQPLRMLQVVVVVLERAPGVVRRVDEDALHPAAVEGQQRLQRIQVVALHQQVAGRGGGVAHPRPSGMRAQHPGGRGGSGAEGGVAVQPVKGGHGARDAGAIRRGCQSRRRCRRSRCGPSAWPAHRPSQCARGAATGRPRCRGARRSRLQSC